MYCKYCGDSIKDGSAYCPSCGKELQRMDIQTYKKFSIDEALAFGWKILKNNFITSFFVTVLITLGLLLSFHTKGVGSILSWAFSIYSTLLLTKIAITVPEGSFKFDKKLFLSKNSSLIQFAAAYLLNFFIILAGIILFIIPGIYLYIRLCLWPYLMIEEQCSPLESLKRSWSLTKDHQFKLLQWMFVDFGINFVGILFLGIGTVITFPLTIYSEYFIYRKIKYGK